MEFVKTPNCINCGGKNKDCVEKALTNDQGLVFATLGLCRSEQLNSSANFIGVADSSFNKYIKFLDGRDCRTKKTIVERTGGLCIGQIEEMSEEERKSNLLDVADRHTQYAKLYNELTLLPVHRQFLRNRGYSDDAIDKIGYRSVTKYQKLQGKYPSLLAGFRKNGDDYHINYWEEGIIIPIRDWLGNNLAFTIRFAPLNGRRKLPEGTGKYVVASAYKADREYAQHHKLPFASYHLNNGEQPLHVALPIGYLLGDEIDELMICEGILKSDLAAIKHGRVFVGSTGVQWHSSPQQLLAIIKYFKPKKIVLTPDSGSLINSFVISGYNKLRSFLAENGISLHVWWWGQFCKYNVTGYGAPDIDEFTSYCHHKIETFTWEYFATKIYPESAIYRNFDEIRRFPTVEELLASPVSASTATKMPELNNIVNFADFVRYKRDRSDDNEPDFTPDKRQRREIVKNFKSLKAIKRAKNFKSWEAETIFTPTITTNNKYVEFPEIRYNTLIGIRSGMGTGKTTATLNYIKQTQRSFMVITHRNAICDVWSENSKKLGINCYHGNRDGGFSVQDDNSEFRGTTFCIDSLLKIKPESVSGKILVFDEIMSTIQELFLKNSLRKDFIRIANRLRAIIKNAAMVIALDGNLNDSVMSYLYRLDPDKRLVKLLNKTNTNTFKVDFVAGSVSEEDFALFTQEELLNSDKIKMRDRSPLLAEMQRQEGNICVATDSLNAAMVAESIFKDRGMIGVNANSISHKENTLMLADDIESSIEFFLSDPVKFINKYKPQYVIYTPTADAGVDISVPNYFSRQFNIFFGVIGAMSTVQMPARLRDSNCPRTIWVHPRAIGQSSNYDSCDKNSYKKYQDDLFNSYVDKIRQKAYEHGDWAENEREVYIEALAQMKKNHADDDIHNAIGVTIESRLRFEKSNPRECVLYLLLAAGHKITQVVAVEDKEALKSAKEAAESFQKAEAKGIFEGEILDNKTYTQESGKTCISKTMRHNLDRTALEYYVPGIGETSAFTESFIFEAKYKKRDYLKNKNRFYLFNNPDQLNLDEIAKIKNSIKNEFSRCNVYTDTSSVFSDFRLSPGEVNSQYLRISLLKEFGFEWFMENEWMVRNEWFDPGFDQSDQPEYVRKAIAFVEFYNAHLAEFGREYKLKLRKGIDMDQQSLAGTVTKLIKGLLEWLGLDVSSSRRQGTFWYQANLGLLEQDETHQAIMKCLHRRYTTKKVAPIAPQIIDKGVEQMVSNEAKANDGKILAEYEDSRLAAKTIAHPQNWRSAEKVYSILNNCSNDCRQKTLNRFKDEISKKYLLDCLEWGRKRELVRA